MVSCRYAALSGLLMVFGVAGIGYPQTPTTDTLHWLLDQKASQPPTPVVSRAEFPSRGGSITRGRVTVKTSTPQAARRAAIRTLYIHSVRNVGVSLREFAQLRDQMAEAASEIKNLKAKILSTEKTGEGYTVDVELAQTSGDLAQDLQRSALSNFRMIALLPETINGQRDSAPKVETALIGALADKQFRVYDWNFVSSRKPLVSLVSATLGRQNEAAVQLGKRFLANVIVAGRVETKFSHQRAKRPDGKERIITQKMPVHDADLLVYLTIEALPGTDIEATIVTEWSKSGYVTYLADFCVPVTNEQNLNKLRQQPTEALAKAS